MEPTEAAETAVWRVLYDAKVPMADREIVFDAVRAAFTAVPDPLAWADNLPTRYAHSSMSREMQYLADDLRAFMRGDNK